MRLRVAILLLGLSLAATAQQTRRDSLETLLGHARSDSNRVILLNKAGGLYFSSDPQKVKQYADEAMQLARKLDYGRGIGQSYLSFGVYYWTQGQYQQSNSSISLALPYFESLNDQEGIAKAYCNIGLNLKNLGQLSQAIDYYFKSLKVVEQLGDRKQMANLYNNIGVVFKTQERYDQALYYYWQSFQKSAGLDLRNQAGALLNIGQIYQLKNEYTQAISYLNKARSRFVTMNESKGLVMCDNDLGLIYCKLKQYGQGETFIRRALKTGEERSYIPNVITSLLLLGDMRLKTNRAAESFAFFDKAYSLAEKTHQQQSRAIVYKGLAEANARTGHFAKAYQFQSQWIALKDSTFTEESSKKVTQIQAQYNSEKKQAQIELLQKEQQVATLWRNSIGTGLLACLLIAGLVVSRQRLKIRKDTVLLAQSELVAHKNELLETQTHLLEKQARQLQELDEAKSRFFINVTHEFRTPLTLILGTLSQKMYDLEGQTQIVMLHSEASVMHRNAQRLLQLINQLLDLAKMESGQMVLHLQTHDIRPLLKLSVALFSSLADQRNIHLSVQLPPEPLPVSHDAAQLENVITNLLANAFKFTPDGGTIHLQADTVSVENQFVVQLTLDDSGSGIAPDQCERIFERFYQGAASRVDGQPGTGVGLSLVKEILLLHHGTIHIDPKTEPGIRFVLRLPLTPMEAPPLAPANGIKFLVPVSERPAGTPADSTELLTKTDNAGWPLLLIVEDNADVRTFVSNQLQKHYRVLESQNGLLGLKVAQENLPDLIISDWMMPDMDGLELCHQIKTDERTSHIPFLLLTALSAPDKRLEGLETGADDYLTKPFDARELLVRIQNLIASRQRLHERFSREIRVQPKDITVTSADEKFLLRVIKAVEENMANADFTPYQFGLEVGLSRMQLHRKLVALTGQATGDFIRVMRLKRAAQLLEGQAGGVSEIAYGVGFNSMSYFSKCFREQFGVTPNEYHDRQKAPA